MEGSLSLFLSAPFLILLFQSRGRVCSAGRCAWQCWTWVADGRQGTGATGRLWFFELILVHVCISVCVWLCCVPLTYFLGSRVYMCGHESRTGSSQWLWCWSSMPNPNSSTPPSYRHTCAHTHPGRQTLKVHFRHTAQTSLMHACTHKHAHNRVFHTYEYTLILAYREMWGTTFKHMCSHALVIQSDTTRHRQLSFWAEWKKSVMIIWCDT